MASSLPTLIDELNTLLSEINVPDFSIQVLETPPDNPNSGNAWVEITDYTQTGYGQRRAQIAAQVLVGPLTSRRLWYPIALEVCDALFDQLDTRDDDAIHFTTIRPGVGDGSAGEMLAVIALGYGQIDTR